MGRHSPSQQATVAKHLSETEGGGKLFGCVDWAGASLSFWQYLAHSLCPLCVQLYSSRADGGC